MAYSYDNHAPSTMAYALMKGALILFLRHCLLRYFVYLVHLKPCIFIIRLPKAVRIHITQYNCESHCRKIIAEVPVELF